MRPKGAGRTYSRSLWIGDDGSVVRRVCFLGTRVILSSCHAEFKIKEGAPDVAGSKTRRSIPCRSMRAGAKLGHSAPPSRHLWATTTTRIDRIRLSNALCSVAAFSGALGL